VARASCLVFVSTLMQDATFRHGLNCDELEEPGQRFSGQASGAQQAATPARQTD
jgi:hypothetical protein